MEIRRPATVAEVQAAGHLFDRSPRQIATERFLASETHHLLLAYEDGRAIGFVTGIEETHPDKGTEMFLYELAVDETARNRGVGRALVRALAGEARVRGCYGMYVLTEPDNEPALRTYEAADAMPAGVHVMLEWTFTRDERVTPG
jgi:ribosomal protein S18 acetylase RimI-like enzyme